MINRMNLDSQESNAQGNYGIFISYKRKDQHLAGRFYDYFYNRGIDPFMDEHSLRTSKNYWNDLERVISQAPYFLFLLTPKGAEELRAANPEDQDQIYVKELLTAFRTERKILIASYGGVDYKALLAELPEELSGLRGITPYELPESARMFYPFMDELFKDLNLDLLKHVLNWQEYMILNSNTLILPRGDLERDYATLENRFGTELVRAVKEGREFDGENRVREVNMACYAASLIVAPDRSMVDRHAFDYGVLFNLFREMMKDKDFSLRIITTAPDHYAAQDACEFDRLGNSALEDCEEAVFLGSYANLCELKKQEPFLSAVKAHRFSFMVTECALPYAIFHILYKDPWKEFNHVKVDLYSFGIDSSIERRSMIFFENDPANAANYNYFVSQFRFLRRRSKKRSAQLIEDQHEKWIAHWNEIKEEME